MALRPAAYPYWTDGDPSKVRTPDGASALQGFTGGEPPPFQYINYLFYTISSWIQYLDQLSNTTFPNSLMRLINGGNWSFNATSGALAWSAQANLAIPSVPDSSNAIAAGSVTLADGAVAYCVANIPSQSLGDTSTSVNPNEIVNMNFTGNISVGMGVTGPGIPNGTTVLGVAPSSVLLSQNVTSNNTQATYTFSNSGAVSVQTSASTALVPTPHTILLARRAGNVVYLGVNCAQIVLRDGEFKTLIGTGYETVYQAPAGENLSVGDLCYVSPGISDGGRTAGALYKLDVSSANQGVRGTYAGVVITAVSTSATATLVYSGFFNEFGSLTQGQVYYADPAVPGGITLNQPSGSGQKIVPIGYSTSSAVMLLAGVSMGVNVVQFPLMKDEILGIGDGTTTVFNLTQAPQNNTAVLVFSGGLKALPTDASISGQVVTFATAPLIGQKIEAQYVLAAQSYVRMKTELAVDSGDQQTFNLSLAPISQNAVLPFVGGVKYDTTTFILILGTTPQIKFNDPLPVGQKVDVGYFY